MLWVEGQSTAETSRVLAGQLILGWGVFNLVEAIIDHHLLNIHHVRDLPVHVPLYDWAFLAVGGVLFIVIGGVMGFGARRQVSA
jgi:uncharacterized membrane protein